MKIKGSAPLASLLSSFMISIKSEKNVIWAPFRQNSCIFTKKNRCLCLPFSDFCILLQTSNIHDLFFIYYMDSTTEKGKRQDIEGKQPSAQTGTHHASSHHRSHSHDGSHHHHHHHKKDESERMKDRILLNAKRRKLLEKVLLYVVSILAVIMVVICFIAYYFNIQ